MTVPTGVRADLRVHRDPHAPAEARRWAEQVLAAALPGDRRADALLVLSELVTNAVDHGAEPISVGLTSTNDELVVEVGDGGDGWPINADPGVDAVRGRGLRIVETISSEWGVRFHDSGKTVWARLRIRAVGPGQLTLLRS